MPQHVTDAPRAPHSQVGCFCSMPHKLLRRLPANRSYPRAVTTDRESPILPYEWKLAVFADARHCATRSGMFEIDFIRIQEYSPDLQFTERFRWREGRFEVSFELSADEAVLEYRIGFVAPCVCSDIPFE